MKELVAEKKPERMKTSSSPKSKPAEPHTYEMGYVGLAYRPPEKFAQLPTKLSHFENAAQRAQILTKMQQTYGNRYMQKMLQTKIKVGQPGDKYEQEADRVAEQVMRMPEPLVQKQPEEEEEEETIQTNPLANQITPLVQRQVELGEEPEEEEEPIQTKLTNDIQVQRQAEEPEEEEPVQTKQLGGPTPHISHGLEAQIHSLRGGGQPLPQTVRTFFEPRFGCDFGRIRVHADSEASEIARQLNARAFTVGRDIVFGAGQYAPETLAGRKLLGHEFVHVKQQTGADSSSILHYHIMYQELGKKQKQQQKEVILTPTKAKPSYASVIMRKNGKSFAEQAEGITERSTEIAWSKSSKGLVEEAKSGERFLIMNFAINSAQLKPEHKEYLDKIYYGVLAADPMAKITIIGHASRTGSLWFNKRLSRERAKSVREFYKDYMRADRFKKVVGKGYAEPIADNKAVDGRAKNRRVEIIVTPWKPEKPIPELVTELTKGMSIYTFKVDNFAACPFKSTVKTIVEEAFKPAKIIRFDWEGKDTTAEDEITFDDTSKWMQGMVGFVFLRTFMEHEICKVKGDKSTCEKTYPNTASVKGRAIANTFCHEVGHALGLGHVNTVDNYMWTVALHPLFGMKKTFEEKIKIARTLQITPSKFNDSQIVWMIQRIKEKRKMRKRCPHVIEFD
jgi:outer membrane protein OmpA-like peptidoglycan-associated protein